MERKINLLSILILISFILTPLAYSIPPALESVTYSSQDQLLSLQFNEAINPDLINNNGFFFVKESDELHDPVVLNCETVLDLDQNTVLLNLVYEGINGQNESAAGFIYDTWGTVWSSARLLESNNPELPLKLMMEENTVFNLEGEGNLFIPRHAAIPVDLDNELIFDFHVESIVYDEAHGVLSLGFDDLVRFDTVNEDESIDNGPGNGILDPGEDKNGNGVLDIQKSIYWNGLKFSDGTNTVILNERIGALRSTVLQTENAAALDLQLLPEDRLKISSLDPMNISCDIAPWTFTSESSHGNQATNLVPMFLPDTVTTIMDSVSYNLGDNYLYCYLNRPFMMNPENEPVILDYSKIRFIFPGDEYHLAALDQISVINLNTLRGIVSIEDQYQIDQRFLHYGENQVSLEIDPFFTIADDGSMNDFCQPTLTIVPETPSNKAPEVESSVYSASDHSLQIEFDVRIETSHLRTGGIHLEFQGQMYSFDGAIFERTNGNRTLVLYPPIESIAELERANPTDGLHLLMDPFCVFQQTRLNGNRGIYAENPVDVIYQPDDSGPLPLEVFYEIDTNNLVIRFNKPIVETVTESDIIFSGVPIHTDQFEVTDNLRLRIFLTEEDSLSLHELSAEEITQPVVTIPGGLVSSANQVPNVLLENLTDQENLEPYGTSERVAIGWVREFTVLSYRSHNDSEYPVIAQLKRITPHADIFVETNQLEQDENGFSQVSSSDLDTISTFIAISTPTSPTQGVFDQLEDLLSPGNPVIPDHVDLLLSDVRDEVGIGNNDTNGNYIVPGYIQNVDGMEYLVIDTWPQLFHQDDNAVYPGRYGDLIESDFHTGIHAVTNILAKWMISHILSDAEQWIVEGMTSYLERRVLNSADFFGPDIGTPINISLNHYPPGRSWYLQTRSPLMHSYLFFEYLLNLYGNDGLMEEILSRETTNVTTLEVAVDEYRSAHPLPEPFQHKSLKDIYLDFSTACLIDTTNGQDLGLFNIPHVVLEWNGYATDYLRWRDRDGDRPPYYKTCDDWSVRAIVTAYGLYDPNVLLDPLGSFYLDGNDNLDFKINAIRSFGDLIDPSFGNNYIVQALELDDSNEAEFPLSIPNWEFGPDDGDYHSLFLLVGQFGESIMPEPSIMISNQDEYFTPPSITAVSASENSVRLTMDLPWWETGFTPDPGILNNNQQRKSIAYGKRSWLKNLLTSGELDNEGGLTGFTVYRSTEPETNYQEIVSGLTDLVYVDENLTSNRTYYYRVTADYLDPEGSSDYATASCRPADFSYSSSIRTAVSNYGIYGDPNANYPSMEYPIGSGIYYLWEGRFWVGAMVQGEPLVTVADYGNYEWVPLSEEYSRLDVIGDSDLNAASIYQDYPSEEVGHHPLHLVVNQTCQMVPQDVDSLLSHAMIIHVDLVYSGASYLRDVYIGWVLDADIGSGPNGDPDQPHIDDYVAFDESRGLSYMYDADYPLTQVDDTGEFGIVPGYFGICIVDSSDQYQVAHHGWWDWENDPGTDSAKYAYLSGTASLYRGHQYMPDPEELGIDPFDYRILYSLGPFILAQDDTVSLDVALMVGDGLAHLQRIADALHGIENSVAESPVIPSTFSVGVPYPNPFNPSVALPFTIPGQAKLEISVFNILGEKIYRTERVYQAGSHTFYFSTDRFKHELGSGVYFLQVQYNNQVNTQRIMLLK